MRLNVDFDIVGVILVLVLPLVVPEPACLHKLDPAIVAEDCTDERLHLTRHDISCAQVSRDLIQ